MPTTENMGFEDQIGKPDPSKLAVIREREKCAQIAEHWSLEAAKAIREQ